MFVVFILLLALIYMSSGFPGIYDVPHFLKTLKHDVHIVTSLPGIMSKGKTKKLKAHKV